MTARLVGRLVGFTAVLAVFVLLLVSAVDAVRSIDAERNGMLEQHRALCEVARQVDPAACKGVPAAPTLAGARR